MQMLSVSDLRGELWRFLGGFLTVHTAPSQKPEGDPSLGAPETSSRECFARYTFGNLVPKQLSATALQAIHRAVDRGQPVFASAISLVEAIYLLERGRLPTEALRRLESAVKSAGSCLLVHPLDEGVAEAIYQVPRAIVPDMPDRIIPATALHLGLPLITRDRRLQEAGIKTIW
jgi:PIN domain nuclease of toxin-antitoxin system